MHFEERPDGGMDVDAWDDETCVTPEALAGLVASEAARITLTFWAENLGEASYEVTGHSAEHGCLEARRVADVRVEV